MYNCIVCMLCHVVWCGSRPHHVYHTYGHRHQVHRQTARMCTGLCVCGGAARMCTGLCVWGWVEYSLVQVNQLSWLYTAASRHHHATQTCGWRKLIYNYRSVLYYVSMQLQ